MTKEEAKQNIATFIEKVESLQEDLMDLEDGAFYAYYAVKPYDGRDLLTREQDEMKEWFRELRLTAYYAKFALSDMVINFGLLD